MKKFVVQYVSRLLIISIIFQIGFVPYNTALALSSFVSIEEEHLPEDIFSEEKIEEYRLSPSYIEENLVYENGIYEYEINENILCQSYVIEATVGVTTIEQIHSKLPPRIDDYDINWPAVIGKFAVGTVVIIAVGIINHYTHVSTLYAMASPVEVTKCALVSGAISATINTLRHSVKGETDGKAILKYSIEGFADGYMWGAITSVLKITSGISKRLSAFKTASNGLLTIKLDGTVLDATTKAVVGRAYFCDDVWYLVNDVDRIVSVFDRHGNEILGSAATEILSQSESGLPANDLLRLGTSQQHQTCRTDENGLVYRVENELLPNIQYQLSGHTYVTDASGRIETVIFPDLKLRGSDRSRLDIADPKSIIGHGSWLTGDDRGHLIADWFNGDNTIANIVPQSSSINHGKILEIERTMAKALSEGKSVSGSIKILYNGTTYRPSEFIYEYDLGNGLITEYISNAA